MAGQMEYISGCETGITLFNSRIHNNLMQSNQYMISVSLLLLVVFSTYTFTENVVGRLLMVRSVLVNLQNRFVSSRDDSVELNLNKYIIYSYIYFSKA